VEEAMNAIERATDASFSAGKRCYVDTDGRPMTGMYTFMARHFGADLEVGAGGKGRVSKRKRRPGARFSIDTDVGSQLHWVIQQRMLGKPYGAGFLEECKASPEKGVAVMQALRVLRREVGLEQPVRAELVVASKAARLATQVDLLAATKDGHLAVVEIKIGHEVRRHSAQDIRGIGGVSSPVPSTRRNNALLQLACTIALLREQYSALLEHIKLVPVLLVVNNEGAFAPRVPAWVAGGGVDLGSLARARPK
jgi:hypothetical protein